MALMVIMPGGPDATTLSSSKVPQSSASSLPSLCQLQAVMVARIFKLSSPLPEEELEFYGTFELYFVQLPEEEPEEPLPDLPEISLASTQP